MVECARLATGPSALLLSVVSVQVILPELRQFGTGHRPWWGYRRGEVSSSLCCFVSVCGGIQPRCMFASDEIHGSTISKLFAELVECAKQKKRERQMLKWSEILKEQDNDGTIRI
ncbi:hypothetical protein HBI56_172280 [Parastagonospora nodorum]|uniref:Uncharacterized protein n=1 Tax=Phaeosphaeria nodorum (strain SN15 / ATCC MYA-4574 / FGSC 10173) TaxID=321614 RepID=A0A7U2I073_PHANO|nr:hypothetical protein HBH56_221010 [Parastagonospora nodorum]QRC97138.1 hypothetical protein JI435_434610 [Parastagonospora nodorum SN15]KAH3924072.1 hypothetical protein HBH54_200730 [Parastagonospora nodorum]KAH3944587.1 hypothetical protein HBH53_157100 [Parastagonospora nodorum]KAH4046254.1 hypothetical protein HBH49_187640 [Parastagonospora nodorum]